MKVKKILDKITANFEKRLQQKTNYGRNEIKVIHSQAINDTLMELLDEKD